MALSYRREREMAQAVRESEERYALAARAANDGLWDWDLDKGTVYYSARWSEMLGYTEDAIGTNPEEWLDRVHPEDRAALMAELVGLKLGEQASILQRAPRQVERRRLPVVAVPGPGSARPRPARDADRRLTHRHH